MTLRFRLGQIVLVIALVAGLAGTVAARDDDSRKDSKKSDSRDNDDRDKDRGDHDKRDYDRYDRYDRDRHDNDGHDNDRHDKDRHDNDRDDRDDDDDDSHHHGNKVTICHKQDHHGSKTITVSASAVSAHQLHGDTIGPCPSSASR